MFAFFVKTENKRIHLPLVAKCGACGLHKKCNTPKMKVSGNGNKRILICGDFPSYSEDFQGKHFVESMLEKELSNLGIRMRQDCWLTNAAICYPHKKTLPEKVVEFCRPNLIQTIKELNPVNIILLGKVAVKSLISWLWKENVDSGARWFGTQIPCQRLNAWICPVWHPSFISETGYGVSQRDNEVRKLIFKQHLASAVELTERPWKKVPDYRSQVEVILNDKEAAKAICHFIRSEVPVAIDYETNMLKPDHGSARIVSCSLSDGKRTIAYPFYGEAISGTQVFLKLDIPKIAANAKFEERWTRKTFGHGINKWDFDTMLAAHLLDNKPGVCGLKFQAFVKLGQESYNDHIEPYLKADGSNEENRIKEIAIKELLIYNGLDSLLEWKLAKIQKREIEG
jgi:uracil-DNA glycosylase family 4